MSLAVCLLFDDDTEAAIRRLWRQLESDGIPTLLSHTHGRHIPHLTLAMLREADVATVHAGLAALSARPPLPLRFDAFGTFRRSRCWLAPAVTADLVMRQERAARTAVAAGADLHRHYVPGSWLPHLTLAPRLHLRDLATVASRAYDVLPLSATATRSAIVDTHTGDVHPLPHLI